LRVLDIFAEFPFELEFECMLELEFECELPLPVTLFILGGEMLVAFAGIAGLAFVSEFVTYPVLVFVPRILAFAPLFAAVLHPPSTAAPSNKKNNRNFIDPSCAKTGRGRIYQIRPEPL